MIVSHRTHVFDQAQLEMHRWMVPRGTLKYVSLRGVDQDELLTRSTYDLTDGRATLCIYLSGGSHRAQLSGASMTFGAGDMVAAADARLLVGRGGMGETLELSSVSKGMGTGRARLSATQLDHLRMQVATLRSGAPSPEQVKRTLASIGSVLAAQGIELEHGLDEEPVIDEKEQVYHRHVDSLLTNLRASPQAIDWSAASGLSRKTLTRKTNEVCQRYSQAFLRKRTDWRAMRDAYRLVIGAIFLRHKMGSPRAVASMIGYQSVSAMGHAFAVAGIQSPGAIHNDATCVRSYASGTPLTH